MKYISNSICKSPLTVTYIILIFLIICFITASLIAGKKSGRFNQAQASLTAGGAVRQAIPVWLGVQVIPIDETVSKNFNIPYKRGLFVRNVINGSPADEAGIIGNDIIREIGKKRIINTSQLKKIINRMYPGKRVRIVYIRDGITNIAYATLSESPIDLNTSLIYGAYPAAAPPTNSPYPYFYFGEEPPEYEKPERE